MLRALAGAPAHAAAANDGADLRRRRPTRNKIHAETQPSCDLGTTTSLRSPKRTKIAEPAATILVLLYGLIEGSTNGWGAVPVASIIAGVMFFAAFAHRQHTATDPLIKASLLQNPSFTSGMLVGLGVFAATTGLIYVLSLFIQGALHANPRGASLALVPLTVGIIAAAFAAMGGLVARLGRTQHPGRRPDAPQEPHV